MTKKERIRIAAAHFEELLGKHGLWKEYYSNLSEDVVKATRDTVYTDWMEWAYKTPLHQWIAGAFFWEKTPQGEKIWRRMDYEWLKTMCRALNI